MGLPSHWLLEKGFEMKITRRTLLNDLEIFLESSDEGFRKTYTAGAIQAWLDNNDREDISELLSISDVLAHIGLSIETATKDAK